ncbi:hypothetical protein H0H87_012327 [Tephrocybe sp. NHM501043]|nr:hypothetical protein H0H87_012327 [Tephrocybe sp. NHM501043]
MDSSSMDSNSSDTHKIVWNPPTFLASLNTSYELQEFYFSSPSLLLPDQRAYTSSTGTRQPGTFDRHLHDAYRLKRVIKLPGILSDLIANADSALKSYPFDIPPSNDRFPSASNRELAKKRATELGMHGEADVQLIYHLTVGNFCAAVASTLEFGFREWRLESLIWSRTCLSRKNIDGVKRAQAVADGFLNMTDMDEFGYNYHLSLRERLILDNFPVIAIWGFKNLNFDSFGNLMGPDAVLELHTGLYIAAIRDAQDRALSIAQGEIPPTWGMKSGLDVAKVQDFSHIIYKQVVVRKLLDQISSTSRPWLIISPGKPTPTHQSYTSNPYRRILKLPATYHAWYANMSASPSSSQDEEYSEHMSQDSYGSWCTESESATSSQADPAEDEVRPDTHTHFQLYTQQSFHGRNISRAKVEIPGVIYRPNFRDADKPGIILKNASDPDTILRLENESNVYDALYRNGVPLLPRKFGFYLSMDPSNVESTFAALLLEDMGTSLAQIKSNIETLKAFRVDRFDKQVFQVFVVVRFPLLTISPLLQITSSTHAEKDTRGWIPAWKPHS